MTLPNFLIIGAAKSGTTAIYTYIKQHSNIYMSPRKELRYFSNINPPNKDVPNDYVHKGVSTLKEYESYFDGVTNEHVYGESSPMYLYTPGTAERIKAVIPDVKLLAILRNPVDRAFSAYTHGLREWKEPAATFEEALQKEPERIKAGWGMLWHYTKAGFYYQQLNRYYQVFNPQQIKVVLYDDLLTDATHLLQSIYKFLEVDDQFEPDTSLRPNVSGFPKNEMFHKLMERLFIDDNLIKRISQVIIPKNMQKLAMVKLRETNLEKRKMPTEIRTYLQELFREDIQILEDLIDRDLSHWLG